MPRLPILNLSTTLREQVTKIDDELWEVKTALRNFDPTDAIAGELADVIQASFGALIMLVGVEGLEEVFSKHTDKLESRQGTDKGLEIIGYLNVEKQNDFLEK